MCWFLMKWRWCIPSLWEEFTFHLGTGLPLCCKALACTVSGSVSHSSVCLGAERSCCLIIPWCGKRAVVRVGTDLCVRKGTKQKERYGQNETAGFVVAWSLNFKGSVPFEMKEWIHPFSYLWGKCLLSLLWSVASQRPVCPQSSYIPQLVESSDLCEHFHCYNTCSLSFSFQQMCAAAKLHIIFIKQHQWLLKAEILFDFFNNSSGSLFAELLFKQAEDTRQQTVFPSQICPSTETMKLVEACGSDI